MSYFSLVLFKIMVCLLLLLLRPFSNTRIIIFLCVFYCNCVRAEVLKLLKAMTLLSGTSDFLQHKDVYHTRLSLEIFVTH
jgi:hypothetical protein